MSSDARSALEQALTQQRGEDQVMLPAGWYAFVHDCAQMRGMEVDGNRLSMKAADLLAATATPQPSADAMRELVQRWRSNGHPYVSDCADELESLLSGGSHA